MRTHDLDNTAHARFSRETERNPIYSLGMAYSIAISRQFSKTAKTRMRMIKMLTVQAYEHRYS